VVALAHDVAQLTFFFGVLDGKQVDAVATNLLEMDAGFTEVAGRSCDGSVVVTPTPTPIPSPTPTPIPGPTATPGPSPTPTPSPTPEPMCMVPDFADIQKSSADAHWDAAGFTGSLMFVVGNGDYSIHYQSLTALSSQPCTSAIVLGP
jgi:hypothetical protein